MPTSAHRSEFVAGAERLRGHVSGAALENLVLRLADGTLIVSPASLDSSTTYVVLEQGRWFEKEWSFVQKIARDGMTIVDVGANAGVYSLALARLAAPSGRVVAFEPSPEARGRLLTGKVLNGADNLEVVDAALSSYEGAAVLTGGDGVQSELGMIEATGSGIPVRVVTLDGEAVERQLTAIDFLKIDAEGAELSIISGGQTVLANQTPLIMFEVTHAGEPSSSEVHVRLAEYGYALFRLVGPGTVLIPYDPQTPLDGSVLNLFAAKPDRAVSLESLGLLARGPVLRSSYDPADVTADKAPFAASFEWRTDVSAPYLQALAAYGTWQSVGKPINDRVGALLWAYDALRVVCANRPSVPKLCTLGRVAVDLGHNDVARQAFWGVVERVKSGATALDEPFWPASRRYDSLSPSPDPLEWFLAAVAEQIQLIHAFSSVFDTDGGITPLSQWLLRTRYASDEMHRRNYLALLRKGTWMPLPSRLMADTEDYLNADLWRNGKVSPVLVKR